MATTSTALTTKVESGSPYQLDAAQVLKASKALLSHIKTSAKAAATASGKQSLIQDDDDTEATPIWLQLTTKKHIIDQKRFKPVKISVPHALNTSTSSICLITADPQRTYKDIIASPEFPAELAVLITRVVGVSKLKKKWNQYEAQRKLYAEHDIFLADDRIITQLPKALGKTFYKSQSKRPIPVSIMEPSPKSNGKKIAKAREGPSEKTGGRGAASTKTIANEITKALSCAIASLTPSTNTAVRIGYASWEAEKLAANVEAVSLALIEKHVAKKWRGVRSLHIKGPETAALPIWLADELWVDENDVLAEEEVQQIAQANIGKKRKSKALGGAEAEDAEKVTDGKKAKKPKLIEGNDDNLDKEIAARKERLKKQKAEVAKDVLVDDIPKASKRTRKGKAVAA
ncbi:electron transfer flavoprotein alpha-subunit [Diplocarpon rosae]|nr:electron transfer flavoprotein alpha-subunit [Diplocarpon rosae]